MPSLKPSPKARALAELELRRRRREVESSEPPPWVPYPDSPQDAAFYSLADVIGFGGAAGGGKSQWLLGMGGTKHYRSTIFRREAVQLAGLIEDSKKLFLGHGSFNGQSLIWRDLPGDRILEFAHVQHPDDWRKHMGRAKGFIGFDELTHFLEAQFWALLGWLRTDRPEIKPQVGCTFNPPTNADERWVIDLFGPWLDRTHPNPAMPGEIRYYARVNGKRIECPDGTPFLHEGELITPLGWTFFPARLDDNPIYKATGYGAQLQSLPEPLRSQLLYGDFDAAITDDPWQIIPTRWIIDAMNRWKAAGGNNHDLLGLSPDVIAQDVAQGGKDKTVNALKYGHWIPKLDKHEGKDTPDGPSAAKTVTRWYSGAARIYIDATGGHGGSSYDQLRYPSPHGYGLGEVVYPLNFSSGSDLRDRSGLLKMANLRAEMMYRTAMALDPDQPGGSSICLPDDPELLQDLAAARYEIRGETYKVESKEEIKKRIGRSPDCFVAGTMIEADRGEIPIEDISIGDFVLTRKGFKRVVGCGETESSSTTMLVTLSNGRTLRGTPNHPIFVDGKGWTPIDALAMYDILVSCKPETSSQWMGSSSFDSPNQNIYPANGITIRSGMGNAFQRLGHSISTFGGLATAKFLRGMKFITRMKTPSITTSQTLNALLVQSIKKGTETNRQNKFSILKEFGRLLHSGTQAQKEDNGIPSTERQHGRIEEPSEKLALNAVKNMKTKGSGKPIGFAAILASSVGTIRTKLFTRNTTAPNAERSSFPSESGSAAPVHVVCVDPAENAPIFNLTVEDQHEYFANGVLVHNCGDAVMMLFLPTPHRASNDTTATLGENKMRDWRRPGMRRAR